MSIKGADGLVYEVFNEARTAAYLSNPDLALRGIAPCDVLEFAGCETYTMFPDCDNPGLWLQQSYTSPAFDPAPWYNATYPDSADALGFYIEEWTGLDGRHITRKSQPWGGVSGGAILGPIGADQRDMAIKLLLFGRTEEAVDYLFRWLQATLGGVCGSCTQDSILVRRFCGSTSDPAHGLGELRKVGLSRGLGWESDVVDWGDCQIRRASLMLTAGDPCLYLPDIAVGSHVDDVNANLTDCFANTNIDPDRAFCRPSCSELAATCRTIRTFEVAPMAAAAPIVTFDNTTGSHTFPFRAMVLSDLGAGVSPNPCGLPILGEIYVRALPPHSTMTWDVAGRDVRYRDATTGGPVTSWAFLEPNDPPRKRFFNLPCSTIRIVMEPATMCVDDLGGGSFEAVGITFDTPVFPTLSVAVQERVDCL